MAPSPRQPLNGQGVRRISGFTFNSNQRFCIRFGSLNVGSLCGKGTEVCEELRRRVDVYCIQEVRWKGLGAYIIGVKQKRYKLWRPGNDSGTRRVGILVKEELCEKVVEVRRKSNRVMVIAFGEEW